MTTALALASGGLCPCSDKPTSMGASRAGGSVGLVDASGPMLPVCQQARVLEFVPEAARYLPGTVVSLRARLSPHDPNPCSATLRLEVTHLGEVVHLDVQIVPLSAGIEQSAILRWRPPSRDFVGYMARLTIEESAQDATTAIDVSSTPLTYPRYGFISVFPPKQRPEQSRDIVSNLSEGYHINLFQFYDWFWRHEDLIPREAEGTPDETWTDLFGRVNSLATIRDLVDAVHAENGAALAYVTMYAARERYAERSPVSPAWGLFEQSSPENQVALAFGGDRYLFLFDPSNAAWQARMASEYIEAVNELDFDGVHIDQFGPRPTYYRAGGTPVELRDTFAPFLEAVDSALTANDAERAACVFNIVDGAVDGYAVDAVTRTTACDVLYSELWFTTDTYEEMRAYIEQLRRIGGGRPVVLALYPQYGEDVGTVMQAEDAELDGVVVDDDHPGYTGTGFVDQFDESGDSITWNLEFERDPVVSFVFRYANATGAPATRTLLIDGVPAAKLRFQSRGAWSDWSFDAWYQQYMAPGEHEVTLSHEPDDAGAVNIDRMTLGAFDEASVRLQNAVVFASGATPIQIGDDIQGLAHEYFPNRSKTFRASLRAALRAQYSFITAHESALFASAVVPIEERLERIRAVSKGHTLITEGSGGIWTVLRSSPDGDLIHLVNLKGVDNALWRDPAQTPEVQNDVALRYEVEHPSAVHQVLWATPDAGPGTFSLLEFTRGDSYIEFTVPVLAYWDVILVR